MTQKQRTILGWTLVILLPIAYLVGSEIYYASTIRPRGVQTVADHFLRFGEPRRVFQLQRDGHTYYELSGITRKRSSLALPVLALPSSPPAYVYDESGKFVDWCSDPGDRPAFRAHWPRTGAQPIEPVTFRQKYGL
jgi:hypothetical protein